MRLWKTAFLLALSPFASAIAQTGAPIAEQSYPAKPVRIIVTTPPGSAGDFFVRTVANGLSELYKQQVLVENRPGAGGLIGATAIVTAPPDGYTIGIASTAHVVAPLLQAKPAYRPIEDITPIALLTSIPSVVVVNANLPAKDIQQLIAIAKAKPGTLNFASLGDGTATHLAAAILNHAADVRVTHIPFRTVSDAQTALMSGEVHYAVWLLPIAVPVLRGERARAIAVTSSTRSSAMPEVPTLAEGGLARGESDALVGLVGPANLSREIVAKLNADIAAVLRRSETRERFAAQGAVPVSDTSPEEYGRILKNDHERYRALISLGLKQR